MPMLDDVVYVHFWNMCVFLYMCCSVATIKVKKSSMLSHGSLSLCLYSTSVEINSNACSRSLWLYDFVV